MVRHKANEEVLIIVNYIYRERDAGFDPGELTTQKYMHFTTPFRHAAPSL